MRQSAEPFKSNVLPPYRRRFENVDKTLHELWIQGLSTRDFEPSLRALLGQETALSPSTISRVNKQFRDEDTTWCKRSILNEYVYLWADGVYLGAGPDDERRVMLVVIGVDVNGDKTLLAIDDAFSESEASWTAVFESLQKRGLKDVALLVTDGAAGIWNAFGKVYPHAKQQRCWLHKIRNVMDKVGERIEADVQRDLREIMHAREPKGGHSTHRKARAIARSRPPESCSMSARRHRSDARVLRVPSRTLAPFCAQTNIIESNFDPVRSRTNVCKRLRSGTSATYLVYALLMRRHDRWRRFNGYQHLKDGHKPNHVTTACNKESRVR